MSLKHLISENKILVSFSIARKVNKSEVDKINKRLQKKAKSDKELNQLLEKEVIKMTKKAMEMNKIPGLIQPEQSEIIDDESDDGPSGIFKNEKRLMILNFFATAVAKKMLDQNLRHLLP